MADISEAVQDQIRGDLEVLMRHARYGQSSTDSFLKFVSECVTPFINIVVDTEGMPGWRSFMTDDFSPVEYSWAWKDSPHIRFGFEPVGLHLDRISDPFNRETPLRCIQSMRKLLKSADWTLFDCLNQTIPRLSASDDSEDPERCSDPSSIFLAAESTPEGGEPVIKAYFPTARAQAAGVDPLTCIRDAFQILESCPTPDIALACLMQYLRQRKVSSPISIALASIDCIDTQIARTKVYFRSPETSFESVRSTLSMDGVLNSWTPNQISQLKDLWYAVLSLDSNFPETHSLPIIDHETSGIVYHASMTPAKSLPSIKVYIPVRHYGVNDLEIANGLVGWMERTGHVAYSGCFLSMLREVCDHRRLDESCGLQTYISVGVDDGGLNITSYFSPELHHPNRLSKLRSSSVVVVAATRLMEDATREMKL